MKVYTSALGRMRIAVDRDGERIWVEQMTSTGKPDIYYRYNSNGRLMKHTRKIFGYDVTPADYTRFGDDTQIEVVKWKPSYEESR